MQSLNRIKPILGTYVSIDITADTSRSEIIKASEAGYEEISRIHDLMSFQEPNSEITKINLDASKAPVEISEDTHKVIDTALNISRATNGIFDISCGGTMVEQKKLPDHGFSFDDRGDWNDIILEPGKIFFRKPLLVDVSGLAKGYAVDKAYDHIKKRILFQTNKEPEICINAGGDLKQTPWKNRQIMIKFPEKSSSIANYIDMQDSCLATSSGEHESTIIRNRKNICRKNKSVSIFASSCMIADALTKVIYSEPSCNLREFTYTNCVVIENGKVKWLE